MTNEHRMKAVNFWQKDPSKETLRTTPNEPGAKERNLIPMEVLGEVVIMNPDTGDQYEVPQEMLDHYSKNLLNDGN